ncbi:MAG: class I SAM-dependent methyltransferase [Actinomycetota bacterium]
MRSRTAPCRLCGGPSVHIVSYDISHLGGYWANVDASIPVVEIRRCSTYGSYFTNEVPASNVIEGQYMVDWDEYYADEEFSAEGKADRCLSQTRRFAPPRSRVMDIGGGNGAFSLAAAEVYDSWLQELTPGRSRRLEEAGVTVLHSVDAAPEATFDAITLWDVYEHVWPHDRFLDPIKRALAPTGLLLIEVPSPTRLVPLVLLLGRLSNTPRREVSFSQVCDFSHLQLTTRRELHHQLNAHGFEVLHSESLSELSYAGVVYARRVIPSERLAKRVGSAVEWRPLRRALLGDNKTFVVARPRTSSQVVSEA